MRFPASLPACILFLCALLRSLGAGRKKGRFSPVIIIFFGVTLTGCGPGTQVQPASENRASLSDESRIQLLASAMTPGVTAARPSVSAGMIATSSAPTSTPISAPQAVSDADLAASHSTSTDPVTSAQNSLADDSQQVPPVLSFAPETQQTPEVR
jgi:hypothetical protein